MPPLCFLTIKISSVVESWLISRDVGELRIEIWPNGKITSLKWAWCTLCLSLMLAVLDFTSVLLFWSNDSIGLIMLLLQWTVHLLNHLDAHWIVQLPHGMEVGVSRTRVWLFSWVVSRALGLINRNSLNTTNGLSLCNPLHRALFVEALCRVRSLKDAGHLHRCELTDKVTHVHVTTANADENLVALLDLDVHSLGPKLVNALRLPQEHDLHLLLLWVRVDECGECLINLVAMFGHVSGHQVVELHL